MVKENHLQQNHLATFFCLLCHIFAQVSAATVHLRFSHIRTATSGVVVLRGGGMDKMDQPSCSQVPATVLGFLQLQT